MKTFLRKFSKFLILGISVFVLLLASQTTIAGNLSKQGPEAVLADNDCPLDAEFGYLGCANPGSTEGDYFPPVTPVAPIYNPAPAPYTPPAPAPTPSCPDDHNYCDTNFNQMIHKTGGVYSPSNPLADANGCIYAFVPIGVCNQPAPQPTQPAPAPFVPASVAPTPVQPVTPTAPLPACPTLVNNNVCGQPTYDTCNYNSDGSVSDCYASANHNCHSGPISCNRPVQPPAPIATLPACTSLVTSSFCGQPAYDTCTYSADGTVASCHASQNPNCTGTLLCNQTQPVRPVTPVVIVPGVGGPAAPVTITDRNTNSNSNVNSNANNININVPTPQTQAVTFAVNSGAAFRCPAGTNQTVQGNQIVCSQNAPVVRVAGVAETKELPKTGLPLIAWAAAAFVPMGAGMKRFNKGLSEKLASHPSYLWEKRLYNIQNESV